MKRRNGSSVGITTSIMSDTAAIIIQIIRLNNFLDLPDTIEIEIEEREPDEHGQVVRASACIIDHIIYLNPTRIETLDALIDTICHELVHIEQGYTGILSYPIDSNDYQWGDKRYPLPKTKEEYLAFPWEVDAFKRGPIIADCVKGIMKGLVTLNVVSGNC